MFKISYEIKVIFYGGEAFSDLCYIFGKSKDKIYACLNHQRHFLFSFMIIVRKSISWFFLKTCASLIFIYLFIILAVYILQTLQWNSCVLIFNFFLTYLFGFLINYITWKQNQKLTNTILTVFSFPKIVE